MVFSDFAEVIKQAIKIFRFTLTDIPHFHNIPFRLEYKELIAYFFLRYLRYDTAQSFKNSAREDAYIR